MDQERLERSILDATSETGYARLQARMRTLLGMLWAVAAVEAGIVAFSLWTDLHGGAVVDYPRWAVPNTLFYLVAALAVVGGMAGSYAQLKTQLVAASLLRAARGLA
ncbi:MAG: hypothetical protein ABR562_01125 [Thermoplasmatota archaeon]